MRNFGMVLGKKSVSSILAFQQKKFIENIEIDSVN
jgi:hypothetical protein